MLQFQLCWSIACNTSAIVIGD